MRTPAEFTKKLKEHVVTTDMLLMCLYSSNKRAKNYRDKEREYRDYARSMRSWNRYWYDKYGNEEKARNKKEEYYSQKEILLSVLHPTCIHKEKIGYEKIRIYDYQPEYRKMRKQFVWENCYFDHELDREVWFGDVEDKGNPRYHYYLFYDLDHTYTFHSPVTETEARKISSQKGLEIILIDHLQTEGHDINELVSNQFVKKVVDMIQSGQYTLDLEENE